MEHYAEQVLLIAADPRDAQNLADALHSVSGLPLNLESSSTLEEGLERLRAGAIDVVLLDLFLPGYRGLETLAHLRAVARYVPVVVLTGVNEREMAHEAVRTGAADYLVKGEQDGTLIVRTLRYAIDKARSEAALKKSEAKYRGLYENLIAGVFQTTPDGHFLAANPKLVALLGYDSEDELMALDLANDLYANPDDRARWVEEIAAAGEAQNTELILKRKDGRQIVVLENSRLVRDAEGSPLYYEGTLTDITELKKLDNLLQDTQAMAKIGGWELDIARNELSWTDEVYRIHELPFGKPVNVDEAIGYYHPDSQPVIREAVEQGMRNGTPWDLELKLVTAKGNIVEVRAIGKVYRRDGKIVRLAGTFQDITEKHQATQALAESQAREGAILEKALDSIVTIDHKGRIIDFNPAAEKLFGQRADEVIGRPMCELIIPERFRDRHRKGIARYLAGGESVFLGKRIEVPAVKADGTEFAVELSITPIVVGGQTAFTGFMRDITERKRAERNLLDNQAFYELILDSVPTRIAYIRADHRIAYTNQAYDEWFQVSRSELTGRKVEEIVTGDALDLIRTRMEKVLGGEVVSFQAEVDREDAIHHLDVTYLPHVGKTGKVRGFFSVVQDMTEHKQLEARLRQAQKMEAVGQLTGGVAHDFNNLLSVIMGNLQLLQRYLQNDEKLLKKLRTATRAAKRGAELTRRLLAFSRQQMLEPRVVNLNMLVAGMDDLLRRTIGESIDISSSFAKDLWVTTVDPGQLENAILNLAINARDAMPEGGSLVIETSNTSLDEKYCSRYEDAEPGDYVMLAVTDSGVGISEEALKKVFDPFFTTKEVGKGSGLGLSMVYGFVEQSGGHARIYSEAGHGTSVKIYLPRSDGVEALSADETNIMNVFPTGDETVLVVEDDPDVRETVVTFLKELGYNILEADNGRNALALIEKNSTINLLFTDVMMPGGMHGPVLAKEAQARRPDLRVLFTTGYAQSAVLKRGDLIGDAEMIGKPYNNEDLARRIREILDEETVVG